MKKLLTLLILMAPLVMAQQSPHGKIDMECQSCHATDSWGFSKNASFKHERYGFALTGQHASLACASCHEGLKFEEVKSNCSSCHSDIHKAELGPNCARCHNASAWQIPEMRQRHDQTRFPLLGRHSTVDCQSCHAKASEKQYAGTPTSCIGCHRNDFALTLAPNHQAAGFSTQCEDCHSLTAFSWGQGFDHNATAFPLNGAHTSTACITCHKDQVFRSTPTQCVACHQPDFATAANPNHTAAQFSTDCRTCHTTIAWQGGRYDHNQTQFPLTGAHQPLSCGSCHGDNVFEGKPTNCYPCHQQDFTGTQNPNHVLGGFSQECQTCHATSAWEPSTFSHAGTQFPLTGAHQSVQCSNCHVNGQYQGTPTNCFACHQQDFTGTTNPNHATAGFPQECQTCHTTAAWLPSSFNHSTTLFPLTGAHQATLCSNCHVNGQYQGTPTNCFACHQQDFTGSTNPNHVAAGFSQECQTCHTTSAWLPSSFDHSTTPFALTGAHQTALCSNCHVNGVYQGTPTNCFACHQQDFTGTTNPNHVTSGFPQECQTCHSTVGWTPSSFNHGNTQFPLTGAHQSAPCSNCHVNGQYQGTPTNCFACHQQDFTGTTNPNHVTSGFPQECQTCHSTVGWTPSSFNHGNTQFPLTGAHQSVTCSNCHVNGQYQGTPTNCFACHQQDFTGTTNPNHVTSGFPQECQTCHSTTAWTPSSFNHGNTQFPLTGAHQSVMCTDCHVNGQYQGTPTNCFACHQQDFTGTTNPNHVTAGFPQECQTCHSTTAWTPSSFNHGNTQFPLTGAHQSVTCTDCHVNGQYQGTPSDCFACHQDNFNGTINPNHVTGNFPHECVQCHTTNAWEPATFDHATTDFQLTGAHTAQQCQSCHTNGNYQLVYQDCFQCHQTDFQQPVNPNHAAGNFSHDCVPCHTTTVWTPSTFSHNSTAFPLTGAHQAVSCSNCHVNNQYQDLPSACFDCHANDFTGTTNPNHVTGNFNHDCLQCHTTGNWSPATFSHVQTNFPLTGSHIPLQCQSCHTNGNYQLVYSDCYQCHQADYAIPTNPNHVQLQLSHQCESCHSTIAWEPSTFNHDTQFFRIYTGHHQGEWNSCSQCHPSIGNYADFTCISCHEHRQSETDNQHQDVNGYVYSSPACYDCHRNTL